MNTNKAIQLILAEYDIAHEKYIPMLSPHEGYAIILEELDELWDEIKKKPDKVSKDRLKKEVTQVGAMALRFLVDLIKD